MTRLLALAALLAAPLLAAPLAHAQRMPVTTTSDAARVAYMRGLTAYVHNDFATAVPHFDAALAADPDFALAHLYRAVSTPPGTPSNDEHLRRAAATARTDAERQFVSTAADQAAGNPERALATFMALADRYPDDPAPPFFAGSLERRRGNRAQAIALYRRALAADPTFSPAYNLIGYDELAEGNPDAAEAAFREYIRLAPDEANPYDSYGEFLMLTGRLDEAEAQFRMALDRDPQFASSRDQLTRIAVMRAFQGYTAAGFADNEEAALAYYIPTAVWSGSRGTERVGVAAVRTANAASPVTRHHEEYELIEIIPAGEDYAYLRARYRGYDDGQLTTDGIDSFIWVRTPQGWKIARDTWTTSIPPAAN